MNKQQNLLKIVKLWKVNLTPEYRGFRCADCQRYLYKAYHHFLDYGVFKAPVHFCHKCQKKFSPANDIKHKIFTCDNCGRNLYKSFHVWTKRNKKLTEEHYCKSCWKNLLR